MSTPQQNTPKGPRRATKHHKQQDLVQRSVVSDNEAYHSTQSPAGHHPSVDGKSKQRRKSGANKRGGALSEAAEHSDGPLQRNMIQPEKIRATPIKSQAYAGPTFHQSPAPSALPIPSFYSRSVPSATMSRSGDQDSPLKGVRDNNFAIDGSGDSKRESTPLDFLFEAARTAQRTPKASSPGLHYLSPHNQTPSSRSPAGRDGGVEFPFEMDTPNRTPAELDSAFSTPYKDRIDGVHSDKSQENSKSIGEDERMQKTAALKKMLMTPQGSGQFDMSNTIDNPFNARNAPVLQQSSNRYQPNHTGAPPMHDSPNANGYAQYSPQHINTPPINPYYQSHQRPPSSNLRNVYGAQPDHWPAELSSDAIGGEPRISTARRSSTARQTYNTIYGSKDQPINQQSTNHKTVPSAQQMENDLRRVLKLDLTSQG